MPIDKLVLLSSSIEKRFRRLALEHGESRGGYLRFIDLSKTEARLPIRLFFRGKYNGVHKAEYIDVAHLGRTRSKEIARELFGRLDRVSIYRIDLCVDVLGISTWDLATRCRVPKAQNFALYGSHGGLSYYPRRSNETTVLIYDRLALLRKRKHPLARIFRLGDKLTRLEIQEKGGGVSYRRLDDIDHYAESDLLGGISWLKPRAFSEDLKPMHLLAAQGLWSMIDAFGLQGASKRFAPAHWAYLSKKFLQPVPTGALPDFRRLLRQSIRDWLEDRIRFPRGPE